MWFFVFSINFARTREGRPARRKLTELLVKSKKTLSPIPPPSFLFFKSIFHVRLRLLSFTSSMLHLVWSRERNDKTLTPTPTGIFLLTASDWEFCATMCCQKGYGFGAVLEPFWSEIGYRQSLTISIRNRVRYVDSDLRLGTVLRRRSESEIGYRR